MSTREDITFKEAFDVFAKTLSENKDLFYAYQSNIAMQFCDAVQRAGINFPQLHDVANKVAKDFLNLLLRDAKEEKG